MTDELSGGKSELSPAKLALLRARMKKDLSSDDTIPPRSGAEASLSFAQQRLWFLDQFYPRSCAYSVPRVFRLTGSLDIAVLEQSLNSIVERHGILRTTFKLVKEEPVQVVGERRTVPLQVVDLKTVAANEREGRARELVEAEVQRPFDLSADLMLRATVLQLKED